MGKEDHVLLFYSVNFYRSQETTFQGKKINKYWWKALLNTLKRWLPWNKSQNCIKCLKASSPSKQRNRDYLVPSLFPFLSPLFYFLFILNWRILALQCCIGFCHTTMWINVNQPYVYIYPPPFEPSSHPTTRLPIPLGHTEHWAELPVLKRTSH